MPPVHPFVLLYHQLATRSHEACLPPPFNHNLKPSGLQPLLSFATSVIVVRDAVPTRQQNKDMYLIPPAGEPDGNQSGRTMSAYAADSAEVQRRPLLLRLNPKEQQMGDLGEAAAYLYEANAVRGNHVHARPSPAIWQF